MNEKEVRDYISQIKPLNEEAMTMARERQESLAKPPGSLGKLEDISVQLAGITGKTINGIDKRCIIILSADNGVAKEKVTSAPQSVTMMQTINFVRRLTGVGALSKNMGVDLMVFDMGIDGHVPKDFSSDDIEDYMTKIINRKIAFGTGNLAKEKAMTREQALQAMETGIKAAEFAADKGYEILGVGEMGIGNTTTSSAILGILTGLTAEDVVGRGGGITDEYFETKKKIVAEAMAKDHKDILEILENCGGFDIAAMIGVFIGAAKRRIPVVIDGYISVVAALAAARLAPLAKGYMFTSHKSFEIGYTKATDELGLSAMLDLGMRLGEGSGCVLAFQIIEGACNVMRDMATFDEAGIDDHYLEEIREGDCF